MAEGNLPCCEIHPDIETYQPSVMGLEAEAILAGFPCQAGFHGVSAAGAQKGMGDDRSSLIRCAFHCFDKLPNARLMLIENVGALLHKQSRFPAQSPAPLVQFAPEDSDATSEACRRRVFLLAASPDISGFPEAVVFSCCDFSIILHVCNMVEAILPLEHLTTGDWNPLAALPMQKWLSEARTPEDAKRVHMLGLCLAKFCAPARRDALLAFRKEWQQLHKLDQDNVAFQTMVCLITESKAAREERMQWKFLDEPVCVRASRFSRLSKAARAGKIAPPADIRYLQRPAQVGCEPENVRSEIVSFLQGLYDSTAETLPDVRDDTFEPNEDASVQLMQHAASDGQDDYACTMENLQQIRTFKNSKQTRNPKRSVQIRRTEGEIRYLPPGTMKEYWEQLNCQREPAKPVSFAFFWRATLHIFQVWYQDFAFLKFRAQSNHATCSVCLRHKMLIKDLSGHLLARKEQVKRYHSHLKDQYMDRMTYWSLRGESRLRGGASITAIIDSMDQSKTCLPRGACMKSKARGSQKACRGNGMNRVPIVTQISSWQDLSNMQRPKCHITAVIIHGFAIFLFLSEHNQPKNSSAMIEMMSHALTVISQQCALKYVSLNIQSDNTVREMKNNPFAKWMASLVSHGNLRECSLRNLRSGHSHEDVDQLFGRAAKWLARYGRTAQTPGDLLEILQEFLNKVDRPYERQRVVAQVDKVRDWLLACRM
ncbi:cofG [Symbiodinium sp. CCMP2592]|nr:cofG [Symbiodinium sp. CCMP2592]